MSIKELAAVSTTSVNIYCLATFKVKANSMRDAAAIAVNSPIIWLVHCDKYKVTWSENDCMMIDVSTEDGSETEEFNYYSVHDAEGNIPVVGDNCQLYEVVLYFNLEVEVNDAEDNEDAIAKADNAEITGEPITDLDVTWCYSESLESSVVE